MRERTLGPRSECNCGDVHADIHELCVTVVPALTVMLHLAEFAVFFVSWGNLFLQCDIFLISFFTRVLAFSAPCCVSVRDSVSAY